VGRNIPVTLQIRVPARINPTDHEETSCRSPCGRRSPLLDYHNDNASRSGRPYDGSGASISLLVDAQITQHVDYCNPAHLAGLLGATE
jgi:hypothetical protein